MKKIYLDYNATTPLDPRVYKVMLPHLQNNFGNPSSIHSFGRSAKAALDRAREQVAELISASPREIVFTSGGSESNNYAIKGAALSLRDKGKTHLITTGAEHESALYTFRQLESEGFQVTYLGVDKVGIIDVEELGESITDETALVSCIYANNETGAVMPVGEIAEIVKEKGALFHTDAVQAGGKLDIDLNGIRADLLSLSAHKIYGPKGTGALFVRADTPEQITLRTLIHGGGQERGKRSGTENITGIVGFGEACEIAANEMSGDRERIRALRNLLFERILIDVPDVKYNGDIDSSLWNTLNMSFAGVRGDSLAMNLDLEGIAVSTGAACSEGKIDPSHVLQAMGVSKEEAASSIRFSLGRFTEKEDVNIVMEKLPGIVSRIRSV
jgi:cysteine desulfurase